MLTNRADPRYLVGTGLLIQVVAFWHMSTLNSHMSFMDAALARRIRP